MTDTPSTPTPRPLSWAGRLSALGATLSVAGIWLWLGWLDYTRLGLIGAAGISIPLLIMLPPLWRGRLRAHQLGSMISCLYMALAAMEIFASAGDSGAIALLLPAALWFGASLLYSRGELRRLQHLRQ